MPVELTELNNWEHLAVPDVYFSHSYHEVSAALEVDGTEPLLVQIRTEGGVFRLPLLTRPIDGKYSDATSCYGYGGPWLEGDGNTAGVRAAFDEWARDRGVVCTFLRLHPVIENRPTAAPLFEVVDLSDTVEWPIAPGVDLLSGMKKKHRQYVRKSERDGLTATVLQNPLDLDSFVDLYLESMSRLEADDFYRFPPDYWQRLSSSRTCATILSEVQFEEKTVASLLCLVGDKLLHAHLLGANDIGREKKANYLAYYAAAKWGQENDKIGFHLGGGYGGDGGDLLAWKRGFCPTAEPRTFSVAKAVHDLDVYRSLAGTDSTEGFFPPWRKVN